MYAIKKCPICGEEFQPKSARQKYCNRPVTRKCAVCGADYESKCTITYPLCCSTKCKNIYAHQQSVAYYTNHSRKCVICGKEFIPRNNTQNICSDIHYKECKVCGKSFNVQKYLENGGGASSIPRTCSKECSTKLKFINGNPFSNPESREKAKQTLMDRYGADHPMHSPEIVKKLDDTMMEKYGVKRFPQLKEEYKEKSIATNREKFGADWKSQTEDWKVKTEATLMKEYGVTNVFKSEEIRERWRANYKAKTGYDNPNQNPEVIEKAKQTNLERYGVECAMNAPEIQEQIRQTMTDKYGAPYVLQSPILVEKIHDTNMKKYGAPIATQNPEIQQKIANTLYKKYGTSHYKESIQYHISIMKDPSKEPQLVEFLTDPESFINNYFDTNPSYKELELASGASISTIIWALSRINRLNLIRYTFSQYEDELLYILRNIDTAMNITSHRRDLIKPYEIDVYLPDCNLGIEMNPTWTHNSSVQFLDPEYVTPPSYHKMKTDMCEKQGISLFHIFGHDWSHKKEIITSMLRNLTGNNFEKIYARKCEIRNVSGKEAFEFLQVNHLQGGVHSAVRYGLYYNDELVFLMTFGRLRDLLKLNDENLSDCWELVRFCSKLNTTIVGGVSKLFNHFIKLHSPKRIITFSGRAHNRGLIYSRLGFKQVSISNPNYTWVNLSTDKAYNRVTISKKHLREFLKDDTIDLSKSEREIMESHGYVRVFDSGTITWEWTSDSL